MNEEFISKESIKIAKDIKGTVRELVHITKPFRTETQPPQNSSREYLEKFGGYYKITPNQLQNLETEPEKTPTENDVEYRLLETKTTFNLTTVAYQQTYMGLPVWGAGLSVNIKKDPSRVISSQFSGYTKIQADKPSKTALRKYAQVTPKELAAILKLKDQEMETLKVKQNRLVIYKYNQSNRTPPQKSPEREVISVRTIQPNLFPAVHPTLPLPPVNEKIKDGQFYVACEIIFELTHQNYGKLVWIAIVEIETDSVLYLRAFTDNVNGMVFPRGLIIDPTDNNTALNPQRTSENLPGLPAVPNGSTQELTGEYIQVSDYENPTAAPPTQTAPNNFNYNARTNNFAAVNAYYHCDNIFRVIQDLGFNMATFFDGTTFPVPIDHRGKQQTTTGIEINAQCKGNGTGGILNADFALADTTDTTNPLGMATNWRVVCHELFGHGILYDHVNSANFGFSHSAGDSFAAILNDPGSTAADRFVTFPWFNMRRHDRSVASGWGWNGSIGLNPFSTSLDYAGYNNEQILSTTMFRIYRAIGGDSPDINMQRFASKYTAYLMLRAISTLTPATNPSTPGAFATALMTVDQDDWTSEGHSGGAYGKVIRWGFEKQGLYQTSGAATPNNNEGDPPPVDVYINDGRNGEYGYIGNFWNTTDIWNRLNPDGGTGHETPILSTTNYLYVKIKNRGSQTATNIVVKCYHNKPGVGLVWPDSWQTMDTPQLAAGSLAAGAEKTVGPFSWTPGIEGHECLLAIVESDQDTSNVNNFGPTDSIPHWRLVPHDNNIAQRNVKPEPGGGGLKALLESFRRKQFWVHNPFKELGTVKITAKLPKILIKKGWGIRFLNEGAETFRLPSRAEKQIVFTLIPGADFTPQEMEGKQDLDVFTHINGILVGGMTYTIDPKITEPITEKPTQEPAKEKPCAKIAQDLLDCLDLKLPKGKVKKAKIKKITVDIELEDDCC